ncbi:MAG: PorT family protein [Bacteroidales bacterium]|nr:PorT family protein [Bacteroidales bacterium]MCD8393949.1 PorT family protein [Bacteroidales bacterium]
MKKLLVALVVALMTVGSASAQFHWGPKVGFTTNKLHMDKSGLDSDNRTGFTGGLMAEVGVPLVGLCFDASLMYVRRSFEYTAEDVTTGNDVTLKYNRDYFEIPVNIKYKIQIIGVEKIVKPYIFTGPSFAFLCSKKSMDAFKNKSFDCSWNFGIGVELLSHLQVQGSYGLGITKSVESNVDANGNSLYSGKDRFWTVTAAWLF